MINKENIKNRLNLKEEEKETLSYIYEFLREKNEWPGVRTTHQKTGREPLVSILNRETPSLVFRTINNDHIEIYGLTFEGIFFSPNAQEDLDLLRRYLRLLINKNKIDPEFREVNSEEVEKELDLDKEKSRILRNLIQIGGFYSSGSFGEEWRVGVPGDIEELIELNDTEEYIMKHREVYFIQDKSNSKLISSTAKKEKIPYWDEIEKEFDISKKQFGRKINFVKDRFKRDVIFRDVEQAYALSKLGFSKPAVILAGSVIEELLRLYLLSKEIKPKNNKFECYINTCEEDGLLKRAIHRLSDSIRCFRNLVHLAIESEEKYSISRPTATAAVASIFTIANDF